MGRMDAAVPEADEAAAAQLMSKAMSLLGGGELDAAVDGFGKAIERDARATRPFALRAKALIRQKRAAAAMADANEVLKRNENSAAGYKWRGKAHALLGDWEAAFIDLSKAQSIDYQDDVAEWLPDVKANAKAEKESADAVKKYRAEKSRRERAAANAATSASGAGGFPGGMPGGFPGMGGMPGMPPGGMPSGMADAMQSPEFMAMLSDPEVLPIIMDIQQNPANIAKHVGNPKFAKIMELVQGMAGGMGMGGGMGGAPPGGMPGGASAAAPTVEEVDEDIEEID